MNTGSDLPKCEVCKNIKGKNIKAKFYAFIVAKIGDIVYKRWEPVCKKHRCQYPAFKLDVLEFVTRVDH